MNTNSWDFQDIAIGFFEDAWGEQYIMVQNPNHASADWPVFTAERADFELDFNFAGAPSGFDTSAVESLNKDTGVVERYPLASLGGDSARLSVTLEAGDVLLFKYATGADFALQK